MEVTVYLSIFLDEQDGILSDSLLLYYIFVIAQDDFVGIKLLFALTKQRTGTGTQLTTFLRTGGGRVKSRF